MSLGKIIKNGLIDENPIFVQVIGMCPTLAVTTSAINGLGMGLSTTAVLVCSNIVIAMMRKIIPSKIRIPAFIVVIATFVTAAVCFGVLFNVCRPFNKLRAVMFMFLLTAFIGAVAKT